MQDRAALAQKLTGISAEKRELLKKLLASKSAGATAIPRRQPGEPIPLTFSQQRLWIIDQLLQGKTAYNETNLIRLPFAVDVECFRSALNEIVRRHEVLRTTIHSAGDDVFQVVKPALTVEVPLVDLRQIDATQREAEALRRSAEESLVRMDLDVGPLIRAVLYRLDANDYLFALTLHHIVCDGWSMGVIAVELSALYWSFALQKPSPLPELPIQYGDFAVWQRKSLNDQVLKPQLEYWRAQLAGLQSLELPTDRPRPAQFSYRGTRLPLSISGSLLRSLTELADRENLTPHIVLLTALMILLHKYTGQDDIAIGSPVAGRTRHELEPLVGFFVNTLVIRADLSGDPEVRECLARVRHVSFAAYANQDVPFERLVEELHPVRDPSRNPLVQVVFQLYQPPAAPGLKPEMVFPFEPAPSGASKFDLHFQLILSPQELRGFLEFNTDLFDATRMERLVGHLRTLLGRMLENPGARISQLDVLTPEERTLLVSEFNKTEAEYPRHSDITQVFAEQAAAHPQHVAVEFEDVRLTYAELHRRSSALAADLAERGVQPGAVVGLLMERCAELPEAMLGILMTGAAYLPLDPNYPKDRLAYLIADSGTQIIVTTKSLRSVAELLDRPCVFADDPRNEAATVRPDAFAPDSIAYLLYTSGTTGMPKGVPLTHRGAIRLVRGVTWVRIGPDDTCFHFAPISYDASVFEIWGALLNGARLVISPPGAPLDELPSLVKKSGVTVLFIATSLLRYLAEHGLRDLREVRQLVTGGEAIPADAARVVWRELPRTRIVNAYGPTECSTIATAYTIRGGAEIEHAVPIGRPVENTTVYIVDRYGHPSPVGVPGEILIGGDAIAPGYWNRPELTRERFVPDHLSSTAGAMLYATGDIGRYREDGNIDFLGRKDRQVKLSGYRIELDEIEAAVASHCDVSAAAALIVDGDSEKRLVVFAERRPGAQVTPSELRSYLAARLPQYMLPSQVEVLDQLPLTPNGKVDIKLLSRHGNNGPETRGDALPPQSALERVVYRIWRDILHADGFGVNDDFFALGGQSLVATRLLSRVRDTFEQPVSMRDFFDNPTIRGLASVLGRDGKAASRAELLLRIESLGTKGATLDTDNHRGDAR